MESFICSQYGRERLTMVNTENIKICGWITKLHEMKIQFVCVFFHICRKFEFLIFQGSVATCLMSCVMSNFIRFPAVQKFENWLRFDKVTDSLMVGNFMRHSVVDNILWLIAWLIFRALCYVSIVGGLQLSVIVYSLIHCHNCRWNWVRHYVTSYNSTLLDFAFVKCQMTDASISCFCVTRMLG